MNDKEKMAIEKHEQLHAYHQQMAERKERERKKESISIFDELSDRTENMELREMHDYIYTLKQVLLCTEALEDISDRGGQRLVESCTHYYTALGHLDLASNAMKMAYIKACKGE